MLGLALKGLLIVAVAGFLAAAILIVARVIAGVLLIILFVSATWLVLRLALRAVRTKGKT